MTTSSTIAVGNAQDLANAPQFETKRNVGGTMGKHDFLMLLIAQLRHQNPLEPQNDQDFGAQLAQFSQLEQLENMNQSMALMALQQSYGLIGKFVVGEAVINGQTTEVYGLVESIFSHEGKTYAELQGILEPVLVSSISAVIDSTDFVNPRMLVEVSNSLVGREIKAEYKQMSDLFEDPEDPDKITGKHTETISITGVVTSVFVKDAALFATVVDNDGKSHEIPVGAIFDIGLFKSVPVAPPEESEEDDELDEIEELDGEYNDPIIDGAGDGSEEIHPEPDPDPIIEP